MRKIGLFTFLVSLTVFAGVFFFSNLTLPKVEARAAEKIEDEDLGEGNIIEQKVDNELLFLVAGVDQVAGQLWSRTDTLILVHIYMDSGEINLISIPRDTRVFIDEEHGNDKINHANAFGGMRLTLRTVRELLGIDLDYYIELGFESVERIVTAIGGVEVEVTVPIHVDVPQVDLELGWQSINGKEALMFVRYRGGYEDGDLGRLRAQQHLIIQCVKEILKPNKLPKLPGLLDIYYEEVQTNIALSTLTNMLPLISNFSGDKISTAHIPGEPNEIDGIYYYEYDVGGTQEIVDKYLHEYKIKPVAVLEDREDDTEESSEETEALETEDYEEETTYEEETEAYVEEYSEESYEETEEYSEESTEEYTEEDTEEYVE